MRPPRVLTWHIHGNYLLYLSHANVEFYLPVDESGREGYGGRGAVFPFGPNVHDIPTENVPELELDCILCQTRTNYDEDRFRILSPEQRGLPLVYLQHDPPIAHPTDARHWVDDPNALLIHVTPFNQLMWDSGETPTRMIDHGVAIPPEIQYQGTLARGLVVVNHLAERGRKLGADVFLEARKTIPLDLVGMESQKLGGLGEVSPPRLPEFEARYRFFFNPIRYTSLGLAILEAMTIGLPIVGLATTELVTVIQNGESGFIDTDPRKLLAPMSDLIDEPKLARRLGQGARRIALERFSIERFASDWEDVFKQVTGGLRSGRFDAFESVKG